MFKNKKGQISLEGLAPIVLIVVIIGMTLAVGITVVTTLGRSDRLTAATTENLQLFNSTNTSLANDEISCDTITVVNASTNVALTSPTNFTADCKLRRIMLNATNNNPVNGSRFNVSYTYTVDSTATNVTSQSKTGMSSFSDFLSVIAIIVVAIVIIGGMAFVTGALRG